MARDPAESLTTVTTVVTAVGWAIPSSTTEAHTWTVLWTNLGPLRTVFTPPASCAHVQSGDNSVVVEYISTSTGLHELIPTTSWVTYRSCEADDGAEITNGCIPSASKASYVIFDWSVEAEPVIWSKFVNAPSSSYTEALDHLRSYRIATYYSPGWHCPSGWRTVASYTLPSKEASDTAMAISGSWQKDILRIGGTHVVCCPSGYAQYITPFMEYGEIPPYGCTSEGTTRLVNSFCKGRCDPSSPGVCKKAVLRTFDADVSGQTLGYQAQPIYMIYNKKDLDWQPSNDHTSTIVPAVVVPVVALGTAILVVLYLLRRRKRKLMWKSRNVPAYGVKNVNDTEENTTKTASDNAELEDTAKFELGQNARQPPELDTDHEIRELAHPSRTLELQGSERQDFSDSSFAQHEMPTPVPELASQHLEPQHTSNWYDNEPFERYPSAIERSENTDLSNNIGADSRLTALQNENARLDEDIRHLQMTSLMEQKRKIEEEIAALRSK